MNQSPPATPLKHRLRKRIIKPPHNKPIDEYSWLDKDTLSAKTVPGPSSKFTRPTKLKPFDSCNSNGNSYVPIKPSMSTLDINHDLVKPSIIQENEHTYLIQIPNKPNNIVFRVQTSFESPPNSTSSTFYKSPNTKSSHILENEYPIFDQFGKNNAKLITKRYFSPSKLAKLSQPTILSTCSQEHNNELIYDETRKTKLATISQKHSIETHQLSESDLLQPQNSSYTFLNPLKISHSTQLIAKSPRESVKRKLNFSTKKIKSKLPCLLVPKKTSLKTSSKPLPPPLPLPAPPVQGSIIQSPTLVLNNPVAPSSQPQLNMNPAQILQNFLMLQSILSQVQQQGSQVQNQQVDLNTTL